jgi:hypothetical protein
MPPYLQGDRQIGGSRCTSTDLDMIEMLFIYQLARNPIKAVARRWWCRNLFRLSRGRRRCGECTNS